jgi:DinB superfamily
MSDPPPTVRNWGPVLYGNPCHECRFDWNISREAAIGLVATMPKLYAQILAAAGSDGSERDPELQWSAGAYVCHVGDNLRIWAERLVGISRGAAPAVAPYDEALLGEARVYDRVALEGAIWSLERAAADWQSAVDEATAAGVVLIHPDRGEQSLLDVVRSNAHDAFHHQWDIQRSLQGNALS